jgi:AcrR family transcriptional regulator
MADVRTERTLAALRLAIVELASANPLSSVTVAQLANTAEINRATFYDHYRSPGELLAEVLRPDLDELRALDLDRRSNTGLSTHQIFRLALIGVAEHITRFRDIYRLALPDPRDNVTHHVLVQHFDDSIRRLLDARAQRPDLPSDGAGFTPAIASRFMAHGFVGAIEAWLEDDSLTRTDLVESIEHSAPDWWHTL